jgi:XTP/dITP diphosphohydrolase
MSKKKILKLLIGSNNQGKIKEIGDLLPKNVIIYTPKDFHIESPKEIGRSFLENSFIKAKFFSKKIKMVCLADDSGLEIDVLNGAPGIYSARWGGKKNNFNLAINKVYRELKKIDENWFKKKITAKFICALTIYWPNNFAVNVIGEVEGTISKTKKGNNGFGYDPIFIPKNSRLTFGQMKPSKKYKIDHRMNAFNKIKKFF